MSVERLANPALQAEALLEYHTGTTNEGLEACTLEDRHDAYEALRLRAVLNPGVGIDAEVVFTSEPGILALRDPEPRRVSRQCADGARTIET